jgi:hypothetical protein
VQLTLVLKVLGLAKLALEFGPDLFEQLVETSAVAWGNTPHAAMRIHGHDRKVLTEAL